MVDNLHPTKQGEAGEEPHGASYDSQSCLGGHPVILYYLIIGSSSKVNADGLQWRVVQGTLWRDRKYNVF